MNTMTVSFSIDGTQYSNLARGKVLDGDWRDGLQLLIESFDGLTYDVAHSILKGTHILQGKNENIVLVAEVDEEYQADVRDIYCDDKFYEMNSLYEFARLVEMADIDEDIRVRGLTYAIPACDAYVRKYMLGSDESIFDVSTTIGRYRGIIARKIDKNTMPVWLTKDDFSANAKLYAKKNLPEVYVQRGFQEIEKQEEAIPLVEPTQEVIDQCVADDFNPSFEVDVIDRINMETARATAEHYGFESVQAYSDHHREKVMSAILERGVEWKRIAVPMGDSVEMINYPYELAQAYALSKTSLSKLAAKWIPVSSHDLKMNDDSQLHTDLWLALGFNFDGLVYNYKTRENHILSVIVSALQKEVFPLGEFVTLNSAGLDSFEGSVVTANSKEITKNNILVIPHAGPEYELQARKAGLVITEVGGKLAHLVIVGREFGLPLIRIDNAMSLFKDGLHLSINFKNNTLTASK